MSNATNNIFEKGQLIRIAGFGYIIGFVFHLIFILEFALLNLNHLLWFNIIFSLPAFLVAFLLSKKGFLYASLFLATVEIISHQVFALLLVGKEGGFQLLLLILVIGSILTENWKNTLIIIGGLVSIIYIGLIWWDFSDYRIYHLPPFQLNILSTTNAVGMLAVIILMFTYYLSREEKLLNQLKQSNHIKDKIVATVSHDLRNPIKSLKPLIKTLQFEKGSSVQSAKTITALNKHINETDHLLDNLLHWASLQIKGIYNMPTSLDLAKVLNKELELFEPLARDKEIEIDKLFNADSAIFVFIDPNMISFIIRNLLSNAIKFTPSGGKIDVEIIKSTGYTAVSIRDTGTGIPEHLISDIFRYGHTSKTKGTNNEEGAGLGLSLCREFILQSKGTIDVVSVEGKGSTFTFVIPTAPN